MASGFTVKDALNRSSNMANSIPRARFRTKDISVHRIYSNELNFYPQDGIEEKAGEILAVGLLEPLAAKYEPCEKGDYKLISGERRWRALKLLVEKGHKEFELVSCQVRSPGNEHEEKIEIILANSSRTKSITVMMQEEQELKKELEYMKANRMELGGYDLQSGRLRDVIAAMLKMSRTKIAQMEAVNNNLIPEFREELASGRMTFSAAYELSGMAAGIQKEAFGKYLETGELSYREVKAMKDAQKAGAEQADTGKGEESGAEPGNTAGQQGQEPEQRQQVSQSDTEEYRTPHPEEIISLCYSCTEYEICAAKSKTCRKCDQYRNRAEAYRTEEQRYSEEQDALDRKTAEKLREMADGEKMRNIPERGQKVHRIKLGTEFFKDSASGKKGFELRKNDRDYREGDILEMVEYSEGKETGCSIQKLVTYMLEDYTGLEDGYCIMGTETLSEYGEPYNRADLNQICADICANADGYTENGEDFILVKNAVGIISGGVAE